MKALVADADRISRAVMKRLLSHIDVEVIEAENGLAALAQLEEADPDFLVIDPELPILSGMEALGVIRRSPVRPDVPVICISASGDRATVARMMELEVADYLLKPVDPAEALPRIRAVMSQAARWRQHTAAGLTSVMLVDSDAAFLEFARPLLQPICDLWDVSSSQEAAFRYREARVRPSIVCLSEGLTSMNEDVLADVLRNMAAHEGGAAPQIFLLSSRESVAESKRARYAGVVRKSSSPESFTEEFQRVVLAGASGVERLRRVLRSEMRDELVRVVAAKIANDVVVVEEDGGPNGPACPAGIRARIGMEEASGETVLHVDLLTGRTEAEGIAARALGRPVSFDEGAPGALGDMAHAIAEGLRAPLLARGIDLQIGSPQVGEEEAGAPAEDLGITFRCAEGQTFRICLRARREEPALGAGAPAPETAEPGGKEPAEEPGASADSQADPAGARAEAS
jgi:CheY-like chemotaxis protein